MDNELQLIGGVRRSEKQLLCAIIWRAWYRARRAVVRKIDLWNYISYNRLRGRNEL